MANAAGSGDKSAIRMKRRNETKIIMRQSIMLVAVLAVIVPASVRHLSPSEGPALQPDR